MCRFIFYIGPSVTLASLITEPSHSIIKQSVRSREREEPLNGDGFGVAWYVLPLSNRPAVFKSISPAWSSRNLLDLTRVTESNCILAHVRAATQGLSVGENNCHPFVAGPYAFMHNGDLGGFARIRQRILTDLSEDSFDCIQGSTDSEHIFAVILDRLRELTGDRALGSAAPVDVMAEAMLRAIQYLVGLQDQAGVTARTYLNMAFTDGRSAVTCRFTTDALQFAESLYLHTGREYICQDGMCRMIGQESGKGTVLVSSEPLSTDEGWRKIPPNYLVLIDPSRQTTLRPIELKSPVLDACPGALADA